MEQITRRFLRDTIKHHLSPDFHIRFKGNEVKVLSPNKTLGTKIIIANDVLGKPEHLDTIGRMLNHSFANKAWEIL